MQEVTLLKGFYRGKELTDINCHLNGMLKQGARGWFGHFTIPGHGMIRVQIPTEKAVVFKSINLTDGPAEEETEEQIIDRIKELKKKYKIAILSNYTKELRERLPAKTCWTFLMK